MRPKSHKSHSSLTIPLITLHQPDDRRPATISADRRHATIPDDGRHATIAAAAAEEARVSSGGRVQQQRKLASAAGGHAASISTGTASILTGAASIPTHCPSPLIQVYGYREKAYQKKKSWYCGSSSSSFDGGDRETISAMESKIAYLNAELAAVAEREKKREEREKKREEEIAAAKEVENKRYAALQAQLTFLF
ncbi:hypothetical protein RDI58_020292 [Solanum bulbocastanum]|uniref:Uncharacterized protein n=1 Tax=Solanum bulbocastanum TaxID=147425 RepID=A0AAN8TEX7_SOLBU